MTWRPITWRFTRDDYIAEVREIQGISNCFSWSVWRRSNYSKTPKLNGDHVWTLKDAQQQAEEALEKLGLQEPP